MNRAFAETKKNGHQGMSNVKEQDDLNKIMQNIMQLDMTGKKSVQAHKLKKISNNLKRHHRPHKRTIKGMRAIHFPLKIEEMKDSKTIKKKITKHLENSIRLSPESKKEEFIDTKMPASRHLCRDDSPAPFSCQDEQDDMSSNHGRFSNQSSSQEISEESIPSDKMREIDCLQPFGHEAFPMPPQMQCRYPPTRNRAQMLHIDNDMEVDEGTEEFQPISVEKSLMKSLVVDHQGFLEIPPDSDKSEKDTPTFKVPEVVYRQPKNARKREPLQLLEKRDVSVQYDLFRKRMKRQDVVEEIKLNEYNRKHHPEVTQDNSLMDSQDNGINAREQPVGFSMDQMGLRHYHRENSAPIFDNEDCEIMQDKENLLTGNTGFRKFN
ncbi:unnamed protein product [Moneuplotes crassus]|uniref:Uncharacterized protein n=1 Tax=Euplotes crassus TaxID=5936 RepID=A0AAD1U8I5_EUPCR|nr:unnamed protein product [Moneuplotes crassus]